MDAAHGRGPERRQCNAIPPRMLAVLLSARLLAAYGPSRVELTSLAVQFARRQRLGPARALHRAARLVI